MMRLKQLQWQLIIGLGALALIRPVMNITGLMDGLGMPLGSILITVLISVVWLAIVVLVGVREPLLTLIFTGLAYSVFAILIRALLSPMRRSDHEPRDHRCGAGHQRQLGRTRRPVCAGDASRHADQATVGLSYLRKATLSMKGTEMMTCTPIRVVVLIALLALALTACTRDTSSGADAPPTSVAAAGPVLGTLEFEGSELTFKPATVQVDQPGRYAVTFTNTGHADHDWLFRAHACSRSLARRYAIQSRFPRKNWNLSAHSPAMLPVCVARSRYAGRLARAASPLRTSK